MMNSDKRKFRFMMFLLIQTVIQLIFLNNILQILSVETHESETTGIVIEVYPLPGETCEVGELFVTVQVADKLLTFTEFNDWFKLYDKIGEEITLKEVSYTYYDGDVNNKYYIE